MLRACCQLVLALLLMLLEQSQLDNLLSLIGKLDNELRLPLVPVSETTQAAIRDAMTHAGLLN